MKNLTSSLLAALVLCRSSASAQAPQDGGQVAVGIRVDTSAPPFRNIFLTWREYLQSGSGMYQPNANWSRADQDRWPFYNLTLPWTHRGSVIHTIDTAWEGPSGSGTRSHRIRLYTASRLAELCLDAGLVVEEAYDGFRDRPLTRRSAEMMRVART